MNNVAIAMPEVKESGGVRKSPEDFTSAGQRIFIAGAALRDSVRRVRKIFYCLTYTRARVALKTISTDVKISLGVNFLPDTPDKVKELTGFVWFLLSGSPLNLPDTAGLAGQRGN